MGSDGRKIARFHRETKKKKRFEGAAWQTEIQTYRQTESTTKNNRLPGIGAELIDRCQNCQPVMGTLSVWGPYDECKSEALCIRHVYTAFIWLMMFCEGVIIRLRCSTFSDDLYIYTSHRAPCKNTKKSCRVFISERIGVKLGTSVEDDNAPNAEERFFLITIPN